MARAAPLRAAMNGKDLSFLVFLVESRILAGVNSVGSGRKAH